jgi:hypothetical protein
MPTSTGCAIKFTLDYNEEGKWLESTQYVYSLIF